MSARTASATADLDDSERVCCAPSCWEPGQSVEIAGDSSAPPVLCEFHRRAYLGVST